MHPAINTRIAATIFAVVYIAGISSHAEAASACKGLVESTCASTQTCKWQVAIVAGETSPRTGAIHKASRREYCRTSRARPAAAPAKPSNG